MVEYYATKGKLAVRNGEPFIVADGEEKALSKREFILWTSLNWNILNKESLNAEFNRRMKKYHMQDDVSFEQMLARLKNRGLIVSKSDYLAADALYNLVKDLYVVPFGRVNRFKRALTFVYMYFIKGMPLAYEDNEDMNSLGNFTRFSEGKTKVLEAIVNLYLKKQIVFE